MPVVTVVICQVGRLFGNLLLGYWCSHTDFLAARTVACFINIPAEVSLRCI